MSESTSALKADFEAAAKPSKYIFQIRKRNGDAVGFYPEKIATAITKAILAVEGQNAAGSARVRELSQAIAMDIASRLEKRFPDGGVVDIEEIQDLAELGLMRREMHKVARAYVLYREEQKKKRQEELKKDGIESIGIPSIEIIGADGAKQALDMQRVRLLVNEACEDLDDVDNDLVFELARKNVYNGMKAADVGTALVMAARGLVETDPNYSQVTARLLMNNLRQEALGFLGLENQVLQAEMGGLYAEALKRAIHKGVELELYSDQLLSYDFDQLGAALLPERDMQFTYLGLQTLYDRYFFHWNDQRFELPQVFFMRVAMGLAIEEDQPNERAIEFYRLLSSFDYMSSTPTLFNSGSQRSQLSSCYLTTVPDSLESIYDALKDNALLSKFAGGLGNDWTPVRSLGAHIKGTNGKSQGVIPFLKVVNDTAVAVNQGGKRKGAVCAYLETWHLDVEDFLELRKNTGDERRRTHDMNSANWIPDLFMKRVFENKEWTLFSPSDVPDLHDLYGKAFEARYEEYERMVEAGEITLFRKIEATALWRKILSMLFETGHPWVTFKDPCNIRSPQQHMGVVHSSNLCTEITLNTSEEEIAVCNLGSVNLSQHIENGQLNREKLRSTIHRAVRMLDNVIDINYYPVPQARNSNLRHRPVGLGIMGFQDALYQLGLPYASIEAVRFADESMELVSYYAIEASALLAKDRGTYESYEGSLWSQGILPIDSLRQLAQERGEQFTTMDYTQQLDWQPIRDLIKQYGMRNSNVMAIAPTATISNIVGVSQSIEPTYQNLYVKSNLSGEFTVINPWLAKELKKLGVWDSVMINDLKYYDGSLAALDRVPDEIKALFATAFEIDSRWLVEAGARRQKWIDQAQSLNLYMAEPSGQRLDNLYKTAWSRGLKTTYYLRSLGATGMEKMAEANKAAAEKKAAEEPAQSAVDAASMDFALGEMQNEAPKVCSILEPDCEACQ
ncbi:MAG: ribonucleoside-diphosphate reductase subunit alpha [Pseudomonadota bacterium]|nr:ribonucleoside-diphosphate reductase subunit alpha [Pseudomonadota bacterium]